MSDKCNSFGIAQIPLISICSVYGGRSELSGQLDGCACGNQRTNASGTESKTDQKGQQTVNDSNHSHGTNRREFIRTLGNWGRRYGRRLARLRMRFGSGRIQSADGRAPHGRLRSAQTGEGALGGGWRRCGGGGHVNQLARLMAANLALFRISPVANGRLPGRWASSVEAARP